MHTALFNISFGLYILLKSWHFTAGGTTAIVDSYLADLFAMPVILTFANEAMYRLKGEAGRLNLWMTIGAVVYAAVVFEVIMPMVDSRRTADPIDVMMYAIGAAAWWRFGRSRAETNSF